MLGSIGGSGAAAGLVTDGLIHRWEFKESTGGYCMDSVGDLHMVARTGVCAVFDGSDNGADTASELAESFFDGATTLFIGGIIRAGDQSSAGYEGYLIGGKGGLGDYFWLTRSHTSGALRLRIYGSDSAYHIATGPVLTDGKWYEFYIHVDTSASTATITYREQEHDAPTKVADAAADWTDTTKDWANTAWTTADMPFDVAFASGATIDTNAATHNIRVGYRSAGSGFAGSIALLFCGTGTPEVEKVKKVLLQPTRDISRDVLGTSAVCWLFDRGTGDMAQELIQDDFAESLTFSSAPDWLGGIKWLPQAGFRCGSRRSGKPGLMIGTPEKTGVRMGDHAVAAGFALPVGFTDNPGEAPYTIEVVYQSTQLGGDTGANEYPTVWGSYQMSGYMKGIQLQHYQSSASLGVLQRMQYRWHSTSYRSVSAKPDGSAASLNLVGVQTVTLRTGGNPFRAAVDYSSLSADRNGSDVQLIVQHHQSDSIPAAGSAADGYGAVAVVASNGTTGLPDDRFSSTSTDVYTFVGDPDQTGDIASQEFAQVADMIVREVRVYDRVLTDDEVLQNRAADRVRNGGRIWYVDENAPFEGWGTKEAPFQNIREAFARMHQGDAIRIVGTVEVAKTADESTPAIRLNIDVSIGGGEDRFACGATKDITVTGLNSGILKRVATRTRRDDSLDPSYVAPTSYTSVYGTTTPHLYDTTTMLSVASQNDIPAGNWTFRDLTFDANNLCGHAITFSSPDSGKSGVGLNLIDCTFMNTHQWVDEHTAEAVQSDWHNTRAIRCTGINNRSQMIYLSSVNAKENIRGFFMDGCQCYGALRDTYAHDPASTDATWQNATTVSSDDGSALCQVAWNELWSAISPIVANCIISGPGASGVIFGRAIRGVVYNTVVSFDGASGIAFRMGYEGGGDYRHSTDCMVISCTSDGGDIGIKYAGSGLVATNCVFSGAGTADIYDEIVGAAGIGDATVTYCLGQTNHIGAGTGNIPASTNIVFTQTGGDKGDPAYWTLDASSDGYLAGTNLIDTYSYLAKDIAGTLRPVSGAWSMGALA